MVVPWILEQPLGDFIVIVVLVLGHDVEELLVLNSKVECHMNPVHQFFFAFGPPILIRVCNGEWILRELFFIESFQCKRLMAQNIVFAQGLIILKDCFL